MRRILVILIAALAMTAPAVAQESVTLTTPASIGTRSTWRPSLLTIELQPDNTWRVVIEARDNLGLTVRCDHTGADAAALVTALNTADMRTNSLHKRLLTHLQSAAAHGGVAKIGAGSVTGTAQ